MNNEGPSYSRYNRFEKKRRNTKWLSIFIIIGLALIVIFFGVLVFSTADDEVVTEDPSTEEINQGQNDETNGNNHEDQNNENIDHDESPDQAIDNNNDEQDEDIGTDDEQGENESPDDPEPNNSENYEIEEVENGEDNVLRSYRSDWDPIPTEQSEPHEITWDRTTIDWEEKLKAAELATGVDVDEMNYLWVSGDGPQSVIATFSNATLDNHFRVYIMWIENQGWQPQRVDELVEHDLMDNFN